MVGSSCRLAIPNLRYRRVELIVVSLDWTQNHPVSNYSQELLRGPRLLRHWFPLLTVLWLRLLLVNYCLVALYYCCCPVRVEKEFNDYKEILHNVSSSFSMLTFKSSIPANWRTSSSKFCSSRSSLSFAFVIGWRMYSPDDFKIQQNYILDFDRLKIDKIRLYDSLQLSHEKVIKTNVKDEIERFPSSLLLYARINLKLKVLNASRIEKIFFCWGTKFSILEYVSCCLAWNSSRYATPVSTWCERRARIEVIEVQSKKNTRENERE